MQEVNHKARDHALLSASSSHRWLECPPSAVASELYPNQDTEFTREGTLAHEVAEYIARGGEPHRVKEEFIDEVPKEMIECAQDYRDYIEELTESETTVVLLEKRVDFSPWVPDGFGTCDCIIVNGNKLTIIDYKYGAGVKVEATDNPQMKLYALGALNDYGFVYNIEEVELHIYQPRMNNVSAYTLTAKELIEWADNVVKPIALKASKGEGEYQPGEHCRFCAHSGRCRALTSLCTEWVNVNGLRVEVPVLAPHEVAEMLRIEPMVSLAFKKVKDQAMTTLLNGGDVPGYKVVEGRGSRAWTNELRVTDTLKANGYDLEDYTKTELLSPAAMEKAIGKKATAELLSDLIEKKSGAPAVVPSTDKRPAYDRKAEAIKDFD